MARSTDFFWSWDALEASTKIVLPPIYPNREVRVEVYGVALGIEAGQREV